jgi:two-component system, chemotaxis family, chemotaxis protein CheY
MAKRYTNEELKNIYNQFEELIEQTGAFYLVVDKQIAIRKTIINVLTKAGVEKDYILEAGDAYEALNAIQQKKNGFIILTEFKLPDTEGIKFMHRVLSKRPEGKDKFIFVSSELEKTRVAMAVKMGALGFVKKPVQPDDLTEQLKKAGVL